LAIIALADLRSIHQGWACSKSTLAAMRSRVGHCDKSEYGLFLFAGSQNEKRPPTAWKFEMSNKIAQVSLDFAGTVSMCAGSKEVDAHGRAVS
jgi:hypothetical protein